MAERIGPYRLERRLGSGGMGVVYLAHGPDGKRVAIKVMHSQWSALPEFRERFRSEAAAARRVARFCTAAVLDSSFGEPSYLVTEYIEGRTLAEAVEQDGVLDGGQLESVAVSTAVALGAIHRAGIIHRDLKPSNIILSPYGPKVIDFGIAQIENVASVTGALVPGTPLVISPERLAGQRASAAADVFSWGCVVAYAGTGRWPFGGGNSQAVQYRVMHAEPDLDGLDERLLPLVRAALAKDPEARPTVSGLLERMTGLGLQLTPEAVPATTTTPVAIERPQPTTAQPTTAQPTTGLSTAAQSTAAQRPRPRRRGRTITALALVGAAVVALGTVAALHFLPARSSTFQLVRQDDFNGRYWWPEGQFTTPVTASAELGDGHYRLSVANPRQELNQGGLPAAANVDTSRYADIQVTARASGTGAYGVWCRGNPPKRPDAKYEFYVTGTGEAAIVKRRPGGLSSEITPFRQAFTPTAINHIQARCQGVDGGVRLTLTVNGHQVATATDASGPLRPGAVGVIAYARNVPQASADFVSFTVEARK
ncbi:MAG TPA: serine/threonine-protein kinase [Streptosporangiaceae bacterium]